MQNYRKIYRFYRLLKNTEVKIEYRKKKKKKNTEIKPHMKFMIALDQCQIFMALPF